MLRLCPFLLENLDLTKVPLSVQENKIQRDPKESTETPDIAELLSPIDKAKNDLETDMTHGQLKSFRAHCNLMYWTGAIEQEALFYYWQKKMDKIGGADPTTREKNMVLETPLEEIPVSNENLTQPESTIEYNETALAPIQGPLHAKENVFELIFVSPEELQSKKVPKQATKVSSVITSDKYNATLEEKKRAKEELERQRIEKKQERKSKKAEKESEKQERKRIRLENLKEKQEKAAKNSKTK